MGQYDRLDGDNHGKLPVSGRTVRTLLRKITCLSAFCDEGVDDVATSNLIGNEEVGYKLLVGDSEGGANEL